jgi:hypothetical protein
MIVSMGMRNIDIFVNKCIYNFEKFKGDKRKKKYNDISDRELTSKLTRLLIGSVKDQHCCDGECW